jgi:hypothetical protein
MFVFVTFRTGSAPDGSAVHIMALPQATNSHVFTYTPSVLPDMDSPVSHPREKQLLILGVIQLPASSISFPGVVVP